jgi:PAS domain S-box-containing protein
MIPPEIPADEAARLEELIALGVLDTGPEPGFDALTTLAAHLLGVPVTLVSLIDGTRQWFKSRVGLDATETPREISFCGHVVAANAPLVVADAAGDPRFSDNPLVAGPPYIRFYAGMPLRTQAGHVLGTLCAIDRTPRSLPPEKLEMLRLLAGQVADQLEARRQRRQLAEKNAALEKSEARLRVGEARLRALFDGMSDGVAEQDRSGAIVDCNPAAERILGLTREQLMGRSSVDPRWRATHPDGSDFPGEGHPAMVALRTGKRPVAVPMRIRKPDGAITPIEVSAAPVSLDADGLPRSVVVTFRDVTQETVMRERIARQERLAATGTLAAGVGHEINNPLTFIHANLDWALEECKRSGAGLPTPVLRNVMAAVGDAREGAERIRKIVRGLRNMARDEGPLVPLELSSVLEGAASMAMHEVRSKARLELLTGRVPYVLADEGGLSQVLVNLIVNAAQAFTEPDPTRNLITVRCSVEPDGRISVEVEDNGPGITAEVLPRIFDPFFSTKDHFKGQGRAAGIGLPVCHGLVTAMKGEISCRTRPGEGTAFKVLLQPAPRTASQPALDGPPAARGRVLAIDDEPGLLDVLSRLLGGEHEVVTCSDPRAALRKLVEGAEQFDVIFCDLMMPHLSGVELFRQVRDRRPGLAGRFVFITGGVTDEGVRTFLAGLPNLCLDKPFERKQLRELARSFAGQPEAGRVTLDA